MIPGWNRWKDKHPQFFTGCWDCDKRGNWLARHESGRYDFRERCKKCDSQGYFDTPAYAAHINSIIERLKVAKEFTVDDWSEDEEQNLIGQLVVYGGEAHVTFVDQDGEDRYMNEESLEDVAQDLFRLNLLNLIPEAKK